MAPGGPISNPTGVPDQPRTGGPSPEMRRRKERDRYIGMALLVGMPWLMFVTLSVLWTFGYHHFYLVVWMIALAWFCFACGFLAMDAQEKMAGSWYLFLAMVCFFAIINASLCGGYNYWTHMFHYWSFDENRGYTNVLPSEPADARQDAGTIVFSNTARVDTTRAVGYKAGTTYCVAPIMDDTQLDRVEYWAAGTNCCTSRGDFVCDATYNPKAKSGVVILDVVPGDASISTGETSIGLTLWAPILPYFKKAAKQAEAHYALTSAKNAIFVRWVADTQMVQDEFWAGGTSFLLATVFIYLGISLVLGIPLQLQSESLAVAAGATVYGRP